MPDMKEKQYLVNPLNLAAALCTAAASLILAATFIYIGSLFPALIFFIIAAVFLIVATYSAAIISVSEEGVTRKGILGRKIHFPWDEIQETGVAGTRLFPQSDKGKAGTLYIYFSKEEMNDRQRFDMMLHWPPKDKIYLQYTAHRANDILIWWSKPFMKYNTRSEEIIK